MDKKSSEEIFHQLSYFPRQRMALFRSLPVNEQGFVLLNVSKRLQREILEKLSNEEILVLSHYLDPDKATDLLQNVKEHRRKKITKALSQDIKEKVEFLLKFSPRSAAGLMSLDYIEIEETASFEEVGEIIKKHEKRTGRLPAIFIVKDGFLLGELPAHFLGLYGAREPVRKYIKKIPTIPYNQDENDVFRVFKLHPHNKIAVLNDDESIIGVIYSDDVLRMIQRRSTRRLYDFAGVSEEEDVFDSFWIKVHHRYKWLIINLGTAFLAASVVSLFQGTIARYVILAVYMPIIAGMGGNAATQTLAVLVRGIALKEITLKSSYKALFNEVTAGFINGIINGAIVAAVAVLWNANPMLGLVVALAMIANLVVAAFFGTIIPLVMKKLGSDPATSATIFITTATDIFGFLSLLGLATLLL